jgi:glycosyltransferase involved in cell wall biosynthesis
MPRQGYRRAESGDQAEDALPKAKAERRPSITALICTLNEEESLPHVLPRIPDWVDEVLLVDGHSADNTVMVAKRLRPDMRIVHQPGTGKGDALRFGVQQATGDIIVTLDADGTTDPEDLPRFIEPLLDGYDFVKGSRFRLGFPANKPLYRILGNWIIAMTFNLLFFRTYTDLCSGYNAFWKEALDRVHLSGGQFEDEPLVNVRVRKAGLKVEEVGHIDQGRVSGNSKAPSWRQGFGAIKTIVRERLRG